MFERWTDKSDTNSPDSYVVDQYCEHKNSEGKFCNEWLGYNYPSRFCSEHQPKQR